MKYLRTVADLVVADRAGVSLHELHLLHPEDFGAPRHYKWSGARYHYTAAGVEALASALRVAGQGAAAARVESLISSCSLNLPADRLAIYA